MVETAWSYTVTDIQWSISAADFGGESVTLLVLSAGVLSAPAKCGESDGRTEEMICGQSMGEKGRPPVWSGPKWKTRKTNSFRIFEWFLCCYYSPRTKQIINTMFHCWETGVRGYRNDKCQLKVYTVLVQPFSLWSYWAEKIHCVQPLEAADP